MKMKLITLLSAFLLVSCVSMQEDVNVEKLSADSEISSFEKRFSEIDAAYFASGSSIKDAAVEKKAEILLSELEKAASNPTLKKAFLARIYALSGCLAFDLGRKSLASKYHEASVQAFKGDERALILARRLGTEKNFAGKIKLFSDKSLLILESALANYAEYEYALALAGFDEAFLSLDGFYRTSYGELRDTSWKLRNVRGNDASALVTLDRLTVMQMLLITNQNPDLLFNYTVGKNLSNKELYAKISGSGLLNPVSKPLDAENALSKDSSVTRLVAARFLWNLYNHRKNTSQNLTKYSVAYANKKRSPILKCTPIIGHFN